MMRLRQLRFDSYLSDLLELLVLVLVWLACVSLGTAHAAQAQAAAAPTDAAAAAAMKTWTALLPIGWVLLTAIVNTIAHFATPKDVDAWAERNPRVAALLSMVRRAGFEPVALIQDAFNFFAGNPPPLGHGAAIGRRPPTSPSASSRGFIGLRLLTVLTFLGCAAAACGLLAVAPDLAQLGLCEAKIAQVQPGLSFPDFMKASLAKCGADAGVTILDLLEAVLASKDPSVAGYQDEARATKADPVKMGALRAHLGGHR
jgi:Na+/proline symporter